MGYEISSWDLEQSISEGQNQEWERYYNWVQIMLDFLFTAHTNMDNFPINEIQEFNNAKMQQDVKRIKTLSSTK